MSPSSNKNASSSNAAGKSEAYRDALFGEKLNILEGIIGYQFSSDYFQGAFLARELGVAESQVSRKKNGNAIITNRDLSTLINLYQLGEHFDYTLFKLDIDDFKKALKESRVGTYGDCSVASARQALLREARSNLKDQLWEGPSKTPRNSPISISIIRNRQNRRSGGFGIAGDDGAPTLVFHPSEQAYFKIRVPGPGHLYVLSDRIDVEITCLMPSPFAERSNVSGGEVRVPAESGFFDVVGPPAYYRLFAIHSSEKLKLPWLLYNDENPDPATILETELPKLVQALKALRSNGGEFYVAARDYRVL